MTSMDKKRLDPLVIGGEAEILAENIIIPRAEETQVLVRPSGVGRLWVEHEYDELEQEQPDLWQSSATAASRESEIKAAQHRVAAAEAIQLVSDNRSVVDDARRYLLRVRLVLVSLRRRAKGTKIWYQLAKAGLLLGDIAGLGTAAIWLGELPLIAILLAISAAVATIASGLLGVEVRDREQRRQRQQAVPELSAAQQEFAPLFTADTSSVTLKRMLIVALGTTGMLGLTIGTLRAAVDEPLIGLVFGGIAMAVAGGSFLVSYAGADEVADLLEHAEADYAQAVAAQLRMSQHASITEYEQAVAERDCITEEYAARGAAAAHRIRALKWAILRRNPSHAGHGQAVGRPIAIGGQTPRREETAA